MLSGGNQTLETHGRGIINLKRSVKKFKIAQRFLGMGVKLGGRKGGKFLSVTVVPFRRLRAPGPLAGKQATDEEAKKDSIAGKFVGIFSVQYCPLCANPLASLAAVVVCHPRMRRLLSRLKS